MRLLLKAVVLLLASGVSALSQAPQVNSVTGVPNYVLYDFFFFRVAWLQDKANHLKGIGLDDGSMRHMIAQQAGLTSAQEIALDGIALDWRTQNAGLLSQIQGLAASGARSSTSPQLQNLRAQRRQLVLDHLTQLQTTFGPGAFYSLDLFVRRTVVVKGPGVTSGN
jgi:hypothetical protein